MLETITLPASISVTQFWIFAILSPCLAALLAISRGQDLDAVVKVGLVYAVVLGTIMLVLRATEPEEAEAPSAPLMDRPQHLHDPLAKHKEKFRKMMQERSKLRPE